MDLLSLIHPDTRLKKVASSGGGEWAGPCPFCGGHDRFRVQPEKGRWWCRQCSADDRWEDAIAYVRRRDGVSFTVARSLVESTVTISKPLESHPAPLRRSEAPETSWQTAAERATSQCVQQLWGPPGERARAWLHRRGLEDLTLERWDVGYSTGQHIEGLWIPRGIVLPWIVRGTVWQLKVRRPVTQTGQPKYSNVTGGKPFIFGLDHLVRQEALVLAEGEFDAMLLWQCVRHRVDVATLGSCSGGLSEAILWELMTYKRLLLAYDEDDGGQRGALKLQAMSQRLQPMRLPSEGDVTDFYLNGGSLVDWVNWNLQ